MGEAGQLKTVVETCLLDGKTTLNKTGTGAKETDCQLGATGSSILTGDAQDGATIPTNTGVPQVTFAADKAGKTTIVATFGNRAAQALKGATVTWTRDSDGSWTCTSTVEEKFAPSGCPKSAAPATAPATAPGPGPGPSH